MVEQKYYKGEGANERLGKKYTKYNKLNNNSKNFRGKIAARGWGA